MKKILVFIPPLLMLAAVVLMALPNAIKLTAKDLDGTYLMYYSFFSIDAFLMGSFLPIIMALLSMTALILLVITVLKPRFVLNRHRAINTIFTFIVIFALISLFLLGMWTTTSILILLLILISAALYNFQYRQARLP